VERRGGGGAARCGRQAEEGQRERGLGAAQVQADDGTAVGPLGDAELVLIALLLLVVLRRVDRCGALAAVSCAQASERGEERGREGGSQ